MECGNVSNVGECDKYGECDKCANVSKCFQIFRDRVSSGYACNFGSLVHSIKLAGQGTYKPLHFQLQQCSREQ